MSIAEPTEPTVLPEPAVPAVPAVLTVLTVLAKWPVPSSRIIRMPPAAASTRHAARKAVLKATTSHLHSRDEPDEQAPRPKKTKAIRRINRPMKEDAMSSRTPGFMRLRSTTHPTPMTGTM